MFEDYDPRAEHLRPLHDALQGAAVKDKLVYVCILADTNGSIYMLGNVQPDSGLLAHFLRVLSDMLEASKANEHPSKAH